MQREQGRDPVVGYGVNAHALAIRTTRLYSVNEHGSSGASDVSVTSIAPVCVSKAHSPHASRTLRQRRLGWRWQNQQRCSDLDEVAQRSAQAIEPPNDEGIPGPQGGQRLFEHRSRSDR